MRNREVEKTILKYFQLHRALIHQMLLYGLIGMESSLVDVCFYFVLTRNFSIESYIANFLSVNIGILCSFFLNTFFNFRKSNKIGKRAISFFAVGYCGLGLSLLMLYLGTNLLHINDIVIKFGSIFIVASVQFLLNKLITYSKI